MVLYCLIDWLERVSAAIMPSQRVVGANLLHGGGKFSYCTPQAHCRSEYAMTDMESWFPANGLSEITSPAVSHNLQRPTEKPLACVADDEVASATGFLGEYQADRWWPTINAHAKDYQTSPQRKDQLHEFWQLFDIRFFSGDMIVCSHACDVM